MDLFPDMFSDYQVDLSSHPANLNIGKSFLPSEKKQRGKKLTLEAYSSHFPVREKKEGSVSFSLCVLIWPAAAFFTTAQRGVGTLMDSRVPYAVARGLEGPLPKWESKK